jgi:hypothetical protein
MLGRKRLSSWGGRGDDQESSSCFCGGQSSTSSAIKELSFTCVRDGSPGFIGVAEVVTEVEMQLDAGSSGRTNRDRLRLGLPSNR